MAQKQPTQLQAYWLQRIARAGGMIVTYRSGVPNYSLVGGDMMVPPKLAQALIRWNWLRGEGDGLFERPQTYRALRPQDRLGEVGDVGSGAE
jgi:hypothetical protein